MGPGIERSKIYFTFFVVISAIHSKLPIRMQPSSGNRKSVSRASLLQERFLQVEGSKRGFVKVGAGYVRLPGHEISYVVGV